jgi:YHS domain-containing protein
MKIRSLLLGAISVAFVTMAAFAADAVDLEGVKCIMNPNAPAKADKSVDYKGGKVFFCCGNCPKKFDAEKNAVAANHQLIATKQAKQTKCPISGQKCSPEHKITVKGATVAFCCPNCKGKAEKASGDDQMTMLFSNAAFDKAEFKVAEPK